MRGWLKFLACSQLFLAILSILSLVFLDSLADLMGLGGDSGALVLVVIPGAGFVLCIIVSILTAIVALLYIRKPKRTGGGGTGPV